MTSVLLAEFPEKKQVATDAIYWLMHLQFRLCRPCWGELRQGLTLMHHMETHMTTCCWSYWHEQMMKLSFTPVASLSNDNSCSASTDLKVISTNRELCCYIF